MISITEMLDKVKTCKTHSDINRMESEVKRLYDDEEINKFTHVYALGFLNCLQWGMINA